METFSYRVYVSVRLDRVYYHEIEAESKEEADKIIRELVDDDDLTKEPYFQGTDIEYDNEIYDNESEIAIYDQHNEKINYYSNEN